MMRVETFTVRGRGPFPRPLLHCDECVPASRRDWQAVGATGFREVTLRSASGAGPRPALWEAEGWPVTCWTLAKAAPKMEAVR